MRETWRSFLIIPHTPQLALIPPVSFSMTNNTPLISEGDVDVEVGIVPMSSPSTTSRPPMRNLDMLLQSFLMSIFGLISAIFVFPVRLLLMPVRLLLAPKFVKPQPSSKCRMPSKVEDISVAHRQLISDFKSGATRSYEWRINQLLGIKSLFLEKEDELFDAYKSDLGKPAGEWFLEKNSILGEVNHTIAHLRELMQPESRSTPLVRRRQPRNAVLSI